MTKKYAVVMYPPKSAEGIISISRYATIEEAIEATPYGHYMGTGVVFGIVETTV